MAKKRAQFDFKRYGRWAVIIGLVAGAYLSRHAASCFIEQVDKFDLAGEVDDGSSTSLIDDSGQVKKGTKGDYAANFGEGAGFFGYMFNAVPYCVKREPFTDPQEVYYGFLAFMGIGVLFLGLDRVITPNWKKELRKKGRADKKKAKKQEDLHADSRAAGGEAADKPKIEPIEVDFGDGDDVSNVLMDSQSHSTSRKGPPKAEDSEPGVEARRGALESLGLDTSSLGSLAGLGGWLGEDDDDDAAEDPLAGMSGAPSPDAAKLGLMNAGEVSADEVEPPPQRPRRSEPIASRGRPPRVVTARVVGEDGEFDAVESLNNPMDVRANVWLPGGREGDPFIFVVPSDELLDPGVARDGKRISQALGGIQAALEAARPHLDEGRAVQLRLLPGVYREQVNLPANVALINHHIPRALSADELRFWLTGDEGFEHEDHVVLALPHDAGPTERVLTLEGGENNVVAGLHVVGRAELDEQGELGGGGVLIEQLGRADFFLCHFVGHNLAGHGAAVEVLDSGPTPEGRVLFQDCLIENNTAGGFGGGIFVEGSYVALRGCAIQGNRSISSGGGVAVVDCPRPIYFDDCSIIGNDAELPEGLPPASRSGWSGELGHGGGIYAVDSAIHLRRCDLVENFAQGSGGGFFASATRVLIEGADEEVGPPARIAGNEAMRGGGGMLSGVFDEDGQRLTALRARQTEFIANIARESGGGLATFQNVHVDLDEVGLLQNKVQSDQGEGGGLHATLGSRVKMQNTTVHKNEALFRGGGVSSCNSSLRVFEGCAITDNAAPHGDTGGLAFYTMHSKQMDKLKSRGLVEEPSICALGPCQVRDNHAGRGIGGVYIGNYSRQATYPIAFSITHPEMIGDNSLSGVASASNATTQSRPVELLIMWKGSIRGGDSNPPTGKRILR